jgi:hypothetical protein
MPLWGALLNHYGHLDRLNRLRDKLLQEASKAPRPATPRQRRYDWLQRAIVEVLAASAEPLSVQAVQEAVERLLDTAVSRDSVSACLQVGARKPGKVLFERVSYGHYRLRVS